MNKTRLGQADLHLIIRKILKVASEPLKGWQIQIELMAAMGKRYSESSVTARLREMRDVRCDLSDNTYKLCG